MAKTVATERAYPISVKWDTIGDPSLFLWRTWREFDSADYYNILFFQDIPIDDDYKEHSIRVMMQEFRWVL